MLVKLVGLGLTTTLGKVLRWLGVWGAWTVPPRPGGVCAPEGGALMGPGEQTEAKIGMPAELCLGYKHRYSCMSSN